MIIVKFDRFCVTTFRIEGFATYTPIGYIFFTSLKEHLKFDIISVSKILEERTSAPDEIVKQNLFSSFIFANFFHGLFFCMFESANIRQQLIQQ